MNFDAIRATPVDIAFDDRPVARRIGLVLLATDHTTERDFARMAPLDKVGLYGTRIAYANPTNAENLQGMQPRLRDGAALILPGERLDAICYGCTAASVVIGDRAVEAAIHEAKPGTPVVTPPKAARAAFKTMGVRRISVLTPYTRETSLPLDAWFEAQGFAVLNLTCFGLDDDRIMARVSPETLLRAAVEATAADAEALFVSCTALRAAETAQRIEDAIGRPVVTANQASVWMSLRYAGINDRISGYGRLLDLPLPD